MSRIDRHAVPTELPLDVPLAAPARPALQIPEAPAALDVLAPEDRAFFAAHRGLALDTPPPRATAAQVARIADAIAKASLVPHDAYALARDVEDAARLLAWVGASGDALNDLQLAARKLSEGDPLPHGAARERAIHELRNPQRVRAQLGDLPARYQRVPGKQELMAVGAPPAPARSLTAAERQRFGADPAQAIHTMRSELSESQRLALDRELLARRMMDDEHFQPLVDEASSHQSDATARPSSTRGAKQRPFSRTPLATANRSHSTRFSAHMPCWPSSKSLRYAAACAHQKNGSAKAHTANSESTPTATCSPIRT